MRQFRRWILSGLAVFSTGLAGWIATSLVAIWGGIYLWQCAMVLEAPGVPLEFVYVAIDGEHTLQAKSFRIDAIKKSAELIGVSLRGHDGSVPVRADVIGVTVAPHSYRVNARGMNVDIRRYPDGSFNLSSLAPKSVRGQFAPNYVFEAKEVLVHYSDMTGTPLEREVVVKSVSLSQAQGENVGRGVVSTTGVDRLPVTAQFGAGGKYWLRLNQIQADADALIPVLMKFVDKESQKNFARLSASGVKVTGFMDVASDGKTPTDVRGQLRVVSDRVVLEKGQLSGRLEAFLDGSLQNASFQARLQDGSRSVSFNGVTALAHETVVAGKVSLQAGDRFWPILAKAIPKGITFRGGKADGWLTFDKGRFGMQGSARMASFEMQGERLDKVTGRFVFNGEKLNVAVDDSRWRGSPLKGAFQTDLKSGSLVGAAHLPKRAFGPMLANLGVHWLQGQGAAELVFRGTTSRPVVDMFAQGNASVRVPDRDAVETGPFEARVSVTGSTAKLDRLTVSGPNGLLLATGQADLKSRVVSADFVAGAFPMAVLSPDAGGTAFAKGTVKGTLEKPTYVARVEGYGIQYKGQGAAQIVGEVRGDLAHLSVDSLRANSGTGSLDAVGSIDWKSKDLTGGFTAKNLSLSQWFGKEFLGTFQIQDGRVSGKYDDPRFEAKLTGEKLNAYGGDIDSAVVSLDGSKKEIAFHDGRITIGGGTITGSGKYDLDAKTGSVSAFADNLPVDRFLRPGPELAFDGRLKGQLDAQLSAKGWNGAGTLSVSAFALNNTPIGAGQLDAKVENSVLSLSGVIGSVDRYLSLDQLTVNGADNSFDAKVAAYNIRIKDVLVATKPAWDTDPAQIPDWVDSLDGTFTGTAAITSEKGAWSIGDSDLTLDNLSVAGRKAGKLVAKVTRSGSVWTVPTLNWTTGESSLIANGSYNENGQMELKARLAEFDLSWIKALVPDSQLVTGKASVDVEASGDRNDPTGRASILVDQATFSNETGTRVSDPLHLLLDDVTFGNKRIDLAGHATFAGFTGTVSADVPYSSIKGRTATSRRESLTAHIKFDDRPLADFKDQFVDIDMDKSDGRLALEATLTGFLEDLKVAANANFVSSKLVGKNLDTELHNVSVSYSQNDRAAHLVAGAESGRGGRFDANLSGNLAHVFGSDFNVDELLDDSSLDGTIQFNQFAWMSKLPGAQLATVGRADGLFAIKGQLRSPVISGSIGLDQLDVNLPNEIVSGVAGEFSVDPQFDNVLVTAGKGSKIETGVGALVVNGTGKINGRLSDPDLNMPLTLTAGNFRLPSGRIALEPGGKIIFTYSSLGTGEPVARVDLDIQGHTTVVSRTGAGQYEPFQVTINIRGNAMDETNLHLTASSDPPGLSQDEILALIGQRDLIQGLAQGVLGGQGDSGVFREALYSFAIPNFAQGLTQGLATGLNLDYLSVDYNPFDQVLLSAGKTIGKGLVLHVTRQLQGTEFGPLRYEVKLEYRLPVADRFLSQVRMGFGFDQSVPWKVTLNWSKRF